MNVMTLVAPVRGRPVVGYLLAFAALGLEWIGFELFVDTLRDFPFLLPLTAVTLAAFFCGLGASILTAAISELLTQYYVLGPARSFMIVWPKGLIGIAFYLALCAIIIALMHGMIKALAALQATQKSLRLLNDQLEQRVAERTATLLETESELRATNQNLEGLVDTRVGELRVANEEIQRFAYIVSHDLRAPLVNVLGFTSELDAIRADLAAFLGEVEKTAPHLVTVDRRLAIEEDLPEALGFIRSSTQKMDRLINAILKLSREGRRTLTPEMIDIAALVTAQGESLSQQLSTKDATLAVAGEIPSLVSDRLAIEQILGNLIENAVKYLSPARPGRVVVSGRLDGSMLRYDIVDNGRGIVATDLERVFELFRRSGEQDTQGEGIGLAYVRNLVRRLGGDVTVMSAFGVGSTFSVTLPAKFRAQLKALEA